MAVVDEQLGLELPLLRCPSSEMEKLKVIVMMRKMTTKMEGTRLEVELKMKRKDGLEVTVDLKGLRLGRLKLKLKLKWRRLVGLKWEDWMMKGENSLLH